MGRKEDRSRVPTDGASRLGGGVSLGDLLRARGLVASETGTAPEFQEDEPSRASAETPEDGPRLGPFPDKVVLRRERKGRGGRVVTRVQGLGWADAPLAELARAMARALGCGTGVEDGDVVLQGDLAERAAAWLSGQGVRRVVR